MVVARVGIDTAARAHGLHINTGDVLEVVRRDLDLVEPVLEEEGEEARRRQRRPWSWPACGSVAAGVVIVVAPAANQAQGATARSCGFDAALVHVETPAAAAVFASSSAK